ncbi:hypothetical protein [Micromonospora sp. RTGN7]|uniref:hypothetical protein n=1 Tax=Micromonospora sp. RTGN7 TaxID=3016526 RepID=UPI0029FF20B9|nr:hypothetical protein [Micromonospora sp. RTGN7]
MRERTLKHLVALLAVALAVALGVAGIVHGEADDSPGLQLLGVLLIVGAVVFGVRITRRGR